MRKPINTPDDLLAYLLQRAQENERRAFTPEESIADRTRCIGKSEAYRDAADELKELLRVREIRTMIND